MAEDIFGASVDFAARPYTGPVTRLPYVVDLEIAGSRDTVMTVEQAESLLAGLTAAIGEAKSKSEKFERDQQRGENQCLIKLRTVLDETASTDKPVKARIIYRISETDSVPYSTSRTGTVEIVDDTVVIGRGKSAVTVALLDVLAVDLVRTYR